jgi:DNA-directed RNA polymerase specialized sigma24 family protein
VRVVSERVAVGREEQLGAERDLELLYRDAAPQLWRAIYGFAGGRRHLAEDAVAEAFARALEHERQIREPLAWIYRTAFRIASRELQREKRRVPAMPDPVPGIDPGEIQDVIRALAELSPTNGRPSCCRPGGVHRPGGRASARHVRGDRARPYVPRPEAAPRAARR